MFKVNNEDNQNDRQLFQAFFSIVSIVDYEQIYACWLLTTGYA